MEKTCNTCANRGCPSYKHPCSSCLAASAGWHPEWEPAKDFATDTNVGHIDANRMNEIMQAEREGRLEIMPCKVGDVLYITEPRFYNYEKHEGVQTGVCKGYEMSPIHGWVVMAALEHGEPDTLYFYAFKGFGKTVFLSRSEAEKALEEAK